MSAATPLDFDPVTGEVLDNPPSYKAIEACRNARWTKQTWYKADPMRVRQGPFKCESWRHAGECAKKDSQRQFKRFEAALTVRDCGPTGEVLFLVLTLDHRGRKEGLRSAYEGLERRWRALKQALTRDYGKFEYATTVEQHRDGVPHMNVVLVSRDLANFYRRYPGKRPLVGRKLAPKWFRSYAHDAGFGYRATLDLASSARDVASYVTKYDHGLVCSPTLQGEVVKMSQLPVRAPKRTRRIRSSRGFLPPARVKNELITGQLRRERIADVERDQAGHMAALIFGEAVDPGDPFAAESRAPPEVEAEVLSQLLARAKRSELARAGIARPMTFDELAVVRSIERIRFEQIQDMLERTG